MSGKSSESLFCFFVWQGLEFTTFPYKCTSRRAKAKVESCSSAYSQFTVSFKHLSICLKPSMFTVKCFQQRFHCQSKILPPPAFFLTTVGFTKGRGTIKSGGRAIRTGEPGEDLPSLFTMRKIELRAVNTVDDNQYFGAQEM